MVLLFAVVVGAPFTLCCPNLKTFSITLISCAVVSNPQNPIQSLTKSPAATTSLPRLIVPATSGTCNKEDNSSCSCIDVLGCTIPP